MPKFEIIDTYTTNSDGSPGNKNQVELVPEEGDLRVYNGCLEKWQWSGWQYVGHLDELFNEVLKHSSDLILLKSWRDEILHAEEERRRKETDSVVWEEQWEDLKMAGDCLRSMRKAHLEIKCRLIEMEREYDKMIELTKAKQKTFDILAADHTNDDKTGWSV